MRPFLAAAAIAYMASVPAAQDQRPSPATRLRSITVLPATDGGARVVIEADGALMAPAAGVPNGPPRIYFDFPGLLPSDRGAEVTDSPAIRRVRVALHSSEPRVTRVVIDLVRPTTHRIEPSTDPSRLIVAIGSSEILPAPVNGVRPHSAPEARKMGSDPKPLPAPEPGIGVRPHSAPEARMVGSDPKPDPKPEMPPKQGTPAPRQADGPFAQLVGIIDRLEKLRPLLIAIDARSTQPGVNLQVAAAELSSIAKAVSGIRFTSRTNRTQGRLVQACGLASQAIQARMESEASGNPTLGWTAASAAAGTLLLLDGARAELGLPPVTE